MKKVLLLSTYLCLSIILLGQGGEELVFVGQLMSIRTINGTEVRVSNKKYEDGALVSSLTKINHPVFEMEYKVKKVLYGAYEDSIIVFKGSDRYGKPRYIKEDKNVVLFLINSEEEYRCATVKHLDVFETSDGRWASDYNLGLFDNLLAEKLTPERIEYKTAVSYSINDLESEYVCKRFPQPFYSLEDSVATALYGYYIDDIIVQLSGLIPYKIGDNRYWMVFE